MSDNVHDGEACLTETGIAVASVVEQLRRVMDDAPNDGADPTPFTYTLLLPCEVRTVLEQSSIALGTHAGRDVALSCRKRRAPPSPHEWILKGSRCTSLHEDIVRGVASQLPSIQHTTCVQRPNGVEVTAVYPHVPQGSTAHILSHHQRKPTECLPYPAVRYAVLYFAGRYCKHSRTLSQTPWFLPCGTRIGSASLEEILLEPILRACFVDPATGIAHTRRRCLTECTTTTLSWRQRVIPSVESGNDTASSHKEGYEDMSEIATFASSGREDIDVRMLGQGRPFVVQVFGAIRRPSEAELASIVQHFATADGDVDVTCLKHATHACMKALQEGEENKKKSYRCVVWSERAIVPDDAFLARLREKVMYPLSIEQWTPIRVLHRRSLLKRARDIHELAIEVLNPHWMMVDLTTSAGTYVKEFIGGDHGRTIPSLGTLLNSRCDIIQLDVVGIDFDI